MPIWKPKIKRVTIKLISTKWQSVGVIYFFCSIRVAEGEKLTKPIRVNPSKILKHKYISGLSAAKSLQDMVWKLAIFDWNQFNWKTFTL